MTVLEQEINVPIPLPARFRGLNILDAVRGATALYVVAGHAATLLFVSRQSAASLSHAVKLFATLLSVFAFGHQAVVMFFVLSGFCIHWKQVPGILGHPSARKFDAADYARRRIKRIVPPYYFAIAIAGLCGWIMHVLTAGRQISSGNFFADLLLVQNNGLSTLIGNLVFLQWIAVPTYGNDSPLWSLSCEFFLYWLYLAYLPLRRKFGLTNSLFLVAATSIVGGIVSYCLFHRHWYVVPGLCRIVSYWFVWVLGAVAAELFRSHSEVRIKPAAYYSLLIALPVWVALLKFVQLPTALSDTITGVLCMGLLLAWVRRQENLPTEGIGKSVISALQRIGVFSYTLYLIHVPILGVIATYWLTGHVGAPTTPWLFSASVPLVVAVSWLAFQLVEKRCLTRT